jgi:hypothetical protein
VPTARNWEYLPYRISVDERERWSDLLAGAAGERASQPRRICELCVELLGITGAGISMVTAQGNRTAVCATDEVAARLADLQFTLGEGASIDAVNTGAPVLISDLCQPGDLTVERWPAFMEGARAAGVRAIFAFPLRLGAISVGALDLYRDRPGELTVSQYPGALMAADTAALALLRADLGGAGSPAADEDWGPRHQMQVHQATGMVKVQAGVTIEEAFLLLRARAFATGVPVAEVASDVVSRRVRFSLEDR